LCLKKMFEVALLSCLFRCFVINSTNLILLFLSCQRCDKGVTLLSCKSVTLLSYKKYVKGAFFWANICADWKSFKWSLVFFIDFTISCLHSRKCTKITKKTFLFCTLPDETFQLFFTSSVCSTFFCRILSF
jgi:hypothetical protein